MLGRLCLPALAHQSDFEVCVPGRFQRRSLLADRAHGEHSRVVQQQIQSEPRRDHQLHESHTEEHDEARDEAEGGDAVCLNLEVVRVNAAFMDVS